MDHLRYLAHWIQNDLQPDFTLLFDAPVELGLKRIAARGEKDRIENETVDFFNRVRNEYLKLAKQFPKRFVIIDASQPLQAVQNQLKKTWDAIFT